MTRTSTLIAFASAVALAACGRETIVADEAPDPMADQLANAAPVTLPPAIVASHKYRCKDNSVIAVEWLSDGTQNSARVTPEGGAAVNLSQAEAEGPYGGAAGDKSLTGEPKASSITFGGQSCKR